MAPAPGRSPSELEDLVLVEAREGQSVLIPPGYGHVTVNPSGETLVVVNLVSSSCVSDYRPFAALRGAAVYLEEFAPKNRLTAFLEVNINNLAAVPSIIFGLLGLAMFINFFGLPRSTPLVGGLVLSLMTMPTIIIA